MLIEQQIAQLLSKRLYLAEDENTYRDPQLDIKQRLFCEKSNCGILVLVWALWVVATSLNGATGHIQRMTVTGTFRPSFMCVRIGERLGTA